MKPSTLVAMYTVALMLTSAFTSVPLPCWSGKRSLCPSSLPGASDYAHWRERLVQPVEDDLMQQREVVDVGVRLGALIGGQDAHRLPGVLQVVEDVLGLLERLGRVSLCGQAQHRALYRPNVYGLALGYADRFQERPPARLPGELVHVVLARPVEPARHLQEPPRDAAVRLVEQEVRDRLGDEPVDVVDGGRGDRRANTHFRGYGPGDGVPAAAY